MAIWKAEINMRILKIPKIITKAALASLAGLLMSTVVMAEGNVANGKKLFTEAKCNQCHTTSVYTKPDRKVKTLKALEAKVRLCDSNLSTNWFDDEIHDVTAYLNQQYYKF